MPGTTRKRPTPEEVERDQCQLLIKCVHEVWLSPHAQKAVLQTLEAAGIRTPTALLLASIRDPSLFSSALSPSLSYSLPNLVQLARTSRVQAVHPGRWVHGVCFTAPHAIKLLRDGHDTHAKELYTSALAAHFAVAVGGGCVTWTREERSRSDVLTEACATNRDPNYLRNNELEQSPFFSCMRALKQSFPGKGNVNLLVDIHGMRDPPAYPADLILGTSAVSRRGLRHKIALFRAELERCLLPVLKQMTLLDDSGDLVDMQLQAGGPATSLGELTGDYGDGSKRNTLCQQGTDERLWATAGSVTSRRDVGVRPFSLAVQVEVSLRLRVYLFQPRNRDELVAFAGAFVAAATRTEAASRATGGMSLRSSVKIGQSPDTSRT
jgi:hypothetical protein